jgi:hypothetical protein
MSNSIISQMADAGSCFLLYTLQRLSRDRGLENPIEMIPQGKSIDAVIGSGNHDGSNKIFHSPPPYLLGRFFSALRLFNYHLGKYFTPERQARACLLSYILARRLALVCIFTI